MRGLPKGGNNTRTVDAFKLEALICDCGAAGEPSEQHAKDCPWSAASKLLKSPPLPNPPAAPNSDVIMRAKDIATSNENTTYPSRASAQYVRSIIADLLALIEERT